jgi:hypothetical protein
VIAPPGCGESILLGFLAGRVLLLSSLPKFWPLERSKSVPKFAAPHDAEPTRRRAGTPAKSPARRRLVREVRRLLLALAL